MEKVMESHGILASQTCTNPAFKPVHKGSVLLRSLSETVVALARQDSKTYSKKNILCSQNISNLSESDKAEFR